MTLFFIPICAAQLKRHTLDKIISTRQVEHMVYIIFHITDANLHTTHCTDHNRKNVKTLKRLFVPAVTKECFQFVTL